MEKRIGLLFDGLRAPYDASHIIQVASALENCDLYISGNSINLQNKKIISKIKSWGINSYPPIEIFQDLTAAVFELHKRGKYLIGTSPHERKSLFDLNLSEGKYVFVFGTESSGLSKQKISKLDELVCIPTSKQVPFLTLPTVVPIVAYEYYRQLGVKNENFR
ncbi:MAG TPA: TrmH family RNA methyltransferase [Candidatus Omnitrophota bacterium]|nr:TrmH family RNA methyltransferase [Candidatus Omnitrophota bacterium]